MAIQDKTRSLFGRLLEQDSAATPFIANPHFPAMEKVGAVETVIKTTSGLPRMGTGALVHTGGEGLMAALAARAPSPPFVGAPPQRPKAGPPAGAPAEGYVRVQIHVVNGQLSVSGIKEVTGPLVLPTTVAHGYAYEVLVDDRQIGLGSIPDAGVDRSFANRDIPDPQGKHHFTEVTEFDFLARIPKTHFSTAILPKLTVVLHQVREAPDRLAPWASLHLQAGVVTTEIGRLSGIKLDQLSWTVRPQIEEILKK
jgi:hypothetical protein